MEEKSEKFYYCQSEIEFRDKCQKQCNHCKTYYYPLEQERKMEDLKEWVENRKGLSIPMYSENGFDGEIEG